MKFEVLLIDNEFILLLKSGNEFEIVNYIRDWFSTSEMRYLHLPAWKAVDFDVVFHVGVRQIPWQEKKRLQIRKWCTLGGALTLYDVLRFGFNTRSKLNATNVKFNYDGMLSLHFPSISLQIMVLTPHSYRGQLGHFEHKRRVQLELENW